MVLKLRASVPLVWRSPTALQFGVDEPRLVLDDLDPVDERLLAALELGTTRPALDVIAREAGGRVEDAGALLDRLDGLLEAPPPRRPSAVTVLGGGPVAGLLARVLREHGVPEGTERGADPALVVLCGEHVLAPASHAAWLRRDVPHLPVLLGDTSARIGPLVVPGETACLGCLERHRADADPAWSAIAGQLLGRPAPAPGAVVVVELAALAARTVLALLDHREVLGDGEQLRVDLATGAVSRRSWAPHPECGCRGLPGSGSHRAAPVVPIRAARGSGGSTTAPARGGHG